ncbi:MAG: NUDIX domain-containing protein [Candidatus Aureabacteria bacterium]|nr:NUDIX domain-containing protein [Candidatus Auribacterota bacterium]
MSKGQEIMVVERDLLLRERPFQGFSPAGAYDYESLILKNYRYAPRGNVEDNPALKQPIAYCIIVNPAMGKIFAYKRAEGDGDYDEVRLRGKWSLGIGGHIDRADLAAENPVRASMLRELGEEIEITGPLTPRILGYINDDMDMVGKVHFGLLYRLDTEAREITQRATEIAESRMLTAGEWQRMLRRRDIVIEEWSRIASGPLLESLSAGGMRHYTFLH